LAHLIWPALALSAVLETAAAAPLANMSYPLAARGDHTDVYQGVKVPDPYHGLEDIDAPETRAWVGAEARMSAEYLGAIPDRNAIARRLRKIWNFERWGPPEKFGDSWFYTHNDGLQNQSVIFVTTDPARPARVLLDPNRLSADGTVALSAQAVSADGRLLAYALADAGSDWQSWHVRDVASGKDLPDVLKWSKVSGASWRKDGSGFYYIAYDEPKSADTLKAANQYQKLYFHRLGTPQSQDALVYTRTDDPDWYLKGVVTEDGRYLVIEATHGDEVQNTVLVQDLAGPEPAAAPVPVIAQPNAVYDVIGNVGATLYVRTDNGAARYRIVAINLEHLAPANWRTIVSQRADALDGVTLVGGQLLARYLRDARSAVRRYTLTGKVIDEVALPGPGTASGFAGHTDDHTTYYLYSSFTSPPSVYSLDLTSGAALPWRTPKLKDFNSNDYETSAVFSTSADGTRVPLFIVARKGAKQDGENPTLLYGYGGFNISLQPAFSPAVAGWLRLGGVYVLAILRGGGEYGRAWHEAGMKIHKQNVFDDFIGAAEYLNAQKWTNPKRLAIWGRSNGGLLVGATLEQRPELFAAAVPQVGVMDMLHFRDFTVGKGWESDFGSIDDPDEFRAILRYSPLQNVKSGINYPAILVTTGDHDDRVFPAHSFKFVAAMQRADPRGRPILLRIETRAGHGAGKPTAKLIEETADIFAFVREAMGLEHP
jgi:prolyl oligopeptidase